jgi:hypothetical protein
MKTITDLNKADIENTRSRGAPFDFFDIAVDEQGNSARDSLVSAERSRVTVRDIPTDAELMIDRLALWL